MPSSSNKKLKFKFSVPLEAVEGKGAGCALYKGAAIDRLSDESA